MALKPDRILSHTDISFFMNAVAERGGMCIARTAGSGAAMDQSEASVMPSGSTASGTYPVGVLMNDMVNKDLSQTHLNQHKDEVQLGGKVTLMRQGQITTNAIRTGVTPTMGAPAYYQPGTLFGNANVFGFTTANQNDGVPVVGRFLSTKDEDGYCKIDINIV